MSIESVMPSNHLILCRPLLLPPSIFRSIRVFSNKSALHIRWPKLSFSFSISPSNEYSGLISFRMDWLDLLAVQGTLRSLLQHHSSKAPIHPALVSAFQPYSLYVLESAMLLTVTGPSHMLFPLLKRTSCVYCVNPSSSIKSWIPDTSLETFLDHAYQATFYYHFVGARFQR